MRWRLSDDFERYAERTAGLLTSDPAEHTVPLTVLESIRGGQR